MLLYNTCSVRAHAEERVYSNVGKLKSLKRRKPRLIIGILGCMAQKDREKIFERLPHVDLVCGTREFPRIAELIEEARRLFSARRSSGAAKSGSSTWTAASSGWRSGRGRRTRGCWRRLRLTWHEGNLMR